MDHNLDPLNLDSAMGVVDFESAVPVGVTQADLSLTSDTDEGIPMEFEHIEEQPMLMETGGEEIIDFMGDGCGEFTLQEYSVQDDQTTGLTTTAESNQNVLTSQVETMLDLQLQPQTSLTTEVPKIIAMKAAPRPQTTTKIATAGVPRQVAIAPKPPRLAIKTFGRSFPAKQFAIAPKPVTLVKTVALKNVVQNNAGGDAMLAQIGKQLVVMPTGTQKLKLVNPSSSTVQYIRTTTDQTSLLQPKEQHPRPVMMTKVIMQGQQSLDLNQSAVLTKVLPNTATSAAAPQPRFVSIQQNAPKSVPVAIDNKIVMASYGKQIVKLGKKQQIIAIHSPSKLLPAPGTGGTSKRVAFTGNPGQNVLKTSPKTAQTGKESTEGQQTHLYQINVPGKGVQYIRLAANPATIKGQVPTPILPLPTKFVLTDNKAGGGKKLVRIAPVVSNTAVTQPARSSQSLLAPLSPPSDEPEPAPSVKREPDLCESEPADSKAALRSLIETAVADDGEDQMHMSMSEVEIDYKTPMPALTKKRLAQRSESESAGEERVQEHPQHPQHPQHSQRSLIVIQSGYDQPPDMIVPDASEENMDDEDSQRSLLMETDTMNSSDSPPTPQTASEPEIAPTEFGLRPRKACNCTKSQCLKLYCDCFANGEFCNRCNCTNCHNNLRNEELRQKAIRGCLERNPNAFRPKIGKAKSGGPEIVRRHNKGCNCKRSGCLKNYCECYEAKIACTAICKCVGCRNVEESLERFRRQELPARPALRPCAPHAHRAAAHGPAHTKQPCSFMTNEVIEAVCQCLVAAAGEPERRGAERDPMRGVIDEFARCLQDIIAAAHHAAPAAPHEPHEPHAPHAPLLDQGTA